MDDTPRRVSDDPNDVAARATDTDTRRTADSDSDDIDARTREIRNEIEETRVEMTETIEAIQDKLTPRNIVARATDRVKTAATERVRDMADTASHTAQEAMDYTRDAASGFTDTVRQNPIPLALIGLGAAWLLARRGSGNGGRYRVRRNELDYGREFGSEWTRDDVRYGNYDDHGLMARIRHNPIPAALAGVGLSWLAFSNSESRDWSDHGRWSDESREGTWGDQPGSTLGEGAQHLTDSASQLASRSRDYVSGATDSMRRMARRRQSQFQHMVHENPLLVGCGALLLGAAFGMAVPETETENEWLGEARDNVVDRAREMARDTAAQVQDTAGSVAEAAGKIAGKTQS